MTNPFTYRPDNPDEDWADNWLSNAMAWGSRTTLPRWCSTPDHWTSRITADLFTDCPCCLLWRGLALGFIAGAAVGLLF